MPVCPQQVPGADDDDLWNRWDLALIDVLIAPDIVLRGSLGVSVDGRDGFARYVALVRDASPDFHNTVETLVGEADTVVARLTYRGTHRGELFGVAPTGKQVTYVGVAIFRVADEQIAEGWVLGDTLGVMRQIGAIPESTNPPEVG